MQTQLLSFLSGVWFFFLISSASFAFSTPLTKLILIETHPITQIPIAFTLILYATQIPNAQSENKHRWKAV